MVAEWRHLVGEHRAVLCGPIRLEVLSGISDAGAFESLKTRLRWFPDESLHADDFEEAARGWNACRSAGIAATHADMVVCALAVRLGGPIFSTDGDFVRYARVLPIRLHRPR
jgi:predicted nucleic acid-binding protein